MDNDESGSVDDYTRATARVLTEAKNRRGISFTALASQAGLGRATVVRILAGTRPITLAYLRALSTALGVSPRQVLDDAEEQL